METKVEMLMYMFIIIFGIWITANSAPVPQKMVDMSYSYNEFSHKYPLLKEFNFSLLINETMDVGNQSYWYQVDEFTSTTHMGTHMDAPSHFTKGGKNIDQLDLEKLIAPAAVIDVREEALLDADMLVTVHHLQRWEERTGHSLNGTIVLLKTGWGEKYHNHSAYLGTDTNDPHQMHFPGLDPVAAQWLVESRSIVGVGTDCMSFDRGASTDFLSHVILLGNGLYGLENVANMDQIPISGAILHAVPINMRHASGSPTRIVAVFPDVVY